MRIVVQRVKKAAVGTDGKSKVSIGRGILALIGFSAGDADKSDSALNQIAKRLVELRCFSDEQGRMNASVSDVSGQIMLVPQFTLTASLNKGKRPSFHTSMAHEEASIFFEKFCTLTEKFFGKPIPRGFFGETMEVSLVNDGPVTFVLDY